MGFQITTAMVEEFKSNFSFLSQQKVSKFAPIVRGEGFTGERASFDRIGATETYKRQGRHADTKLVSTPHDRRWVSAETYDWAELVDKEDKLKMLSDPTNPYAVNAGMAFARTKDDIIVEAALGSAYSGRNGLTEVTWSSGTDGVHIIEESGTDGLTIAKLLEIKETADLADVADDLKWYLAVSPKQITNLLNTTEVKSADYNTVKALAKGEVDSFMGFEFVRSNRLLKTGNMRRCFAFTNDAIVLATQAAVGTDIGPRRDKNNAMQIFCTMTMGAVRMEEVKVIEVQSYEAP